MERGYQCNGSRWKKVIYIPFHYCKFSSAIFEDSWCTDLKCLFLFNLYQNFSLNFITSIVGARLVEKHWWSFLQTSFMPLYLSLLGKYCLCGLLFCLILDRTLITFEPQHFILEFKCSGNWFCSSSKFNSQCGERSLQSYTKALCMHTMIKKMISYFETIDLKLEIWWPFLIRCARAGRNNMR